MSDADQTTQVIQVVKAEIKSIEQLTTSQIEVAKILADSQNATTNAIASFREVLGSLKVEIMPPEAMSSFEVLQIIIGGLTLFAVTVAAIAYSLQAQAMSDQVIEFKLQTEHSEKTALAEQFRIAIKMLNIKNSPSEWHTGLILVSEIAMNNPETYGIKTIHSLIQIGRVFSHEREFNRVTSGALYDSDDKIGLDEFSKKIEYSQFEIDILIINILISFSKIHETLESNDVSTPEEPFKVDNFEVHYHSKKDFFVEKINLHHFVFFHCDFTGLRFEECILNQNAFVRCNLHL